MACFLIPPRAAGRVAASGASSRVGRFNSRASPTPPPPRGVPPPPSGGGLQIPLVLDLRDALGVGARQIPPALQDLQGVLLVRQPERLGLFETEQRHVARGGLPCLLMRALPAEINIDVAVAPLGPVLVIER